MADIMTPALGESVTEATVARWTKAAGEAVRRDEVLAELETDKVTLEISAPADGVLQIEAEEGATVTPGQRLGTVGEAGSAAAPAQAAPVPVKSGGKGKGSAKAGANGSGEGTTVPATAAAPNPYPPTDGSEGQQTRPENQTTQTSQTPAAESGSGQTTQPTQTPSTSAASGGGVEVTVPTMGESVTEGTMGTWSKKVGDRVAKDEVLVEIETDKVAIEVNSPADGVLSEISAPDGATVTPNQVIARVSSGAGQGATEVRPGQQQPSGVGQYTPANQPPAEQKGAPPPGAAQPAMPLSPSVQRIAAENRLDTSNIAGSGKDGRITKGDALAALDAQRSAPQAAPQQARAPEPAAPAPQPLPAGIVARAPHEREERVRMSRLRQTIARRLKDAQNTAAMLTTFNEVDMTAVMALRNQYKDAFEKRHGVKLGFMSFFVRACIAALKEVPAVNAEIDGTDLVYKNHYDIGVAVGTEKGLVVPVVRDADAMSLAEIEKAIGALGKKARDGQLSIEDMQGGTFTISNGGVYGSLMSTPILNAPQSGILGMHKIQERPMVVGGKIEVRPMMYLALSYDHRVVDGKEAVTFLVSVKDHVEDPQRLILDL